MVIKALSRQPKPFFIIFLIEIWERFGYYGLQALLILYMVQRLGFSDSRADFLFAAFSALVFLLPAVGGFIGDKVLGTKRTILLGAFMLAVGYLVLSIPYPACFARTSDVSETFQIATSSIVPANPAVP